MQRLATSDIKTPANECRAQRARFVAEGADEAILLADVAQLSHQPNTGIDHTHIAVKTYHLERLDGGRSALSATKPPAGP